LQPLLAAISRNLHRAVRWSREHDLQVPHSAASAAAYQFLFSSNQQTISRREVESLVGPPLLHDVDQAWRVRQVAVVECKIVTVLVEVGIG
jgi:hypothetical protein